MLCIPLILTCLGVFKSVSAVSEGKWTQNCPFLGIRPNALAAGSFFRQRDHRERIFDPMRKTALIPIVMLCLSLSLPALLHAQEVASLTGVVTDKTGAVVPEVIVTLT